MNNQGVSSIADLRDYQEDCAIEEKKSFVIVSNKHCYYGKNELAFHVHEIIVLFCKYVQTTFDVLSIRLCFRKKG